MLHDRGLFWVEVLASKYLSNEQFLNSKPSPTDSWLWKGILKCMPFVQKGACWMISSGLNLKIWEEP